MASFSEYLKAAFSATPRGMFVAPNYIGLTAIALLGIVEPTVFVLGAGLELAYLFTLATNKRFQNIVEGRELLKNKEDWTKKQQAQVSVLERGDQARYRALEERCRNILQQQKNLDTSPTELKSQGEGLARLTWIYLRLLLTRQTIYKVLGDSLGADSEESLNHRVKKLGEQVKDEKLAEDIRKSLSSQLEIVQQRIAKQKEARDKVAFIEAELTRIEEQVELIREQAAVSADPKGVSDRIDQVAADLSGRSQWLSDQQRVYGRLEEILTEPPPALDAEALVVPPPLPTKN